MQKLLALPILTALLACRPVGVDYAPPKLAVPAAYEPASGAAAAPARWWTTLADARLDGLVQRALAESPDIQVAEAHLRQARALQGVQDAAGGPSLALAASVSQDKLSQHGEMFANIPFPNPRTEFTNRQVGFDASWELDFFGHNRRLSEAAGARTAAMAQRLDDARLILAAEVARNYVELRAWQARRALAGQTLAQFQELARLAQVSLRAGDTTPMDVAQADLAVSNFQAAIPALDLGLRQNLTALASLTGIPLQELAATLAEPAPLMPVPPPPAAGLPSDLLNRRPDLRAAERDLAAANADVGVSLAGLYPRFALTGAAGWNSIQSNNLFSSASRMWSLGPQLSLPLFNRGLLRNQVRASQAAFDAALGSYHKAVLTALADVDVAFTRLARDEDRRRQLEESQARQQRITDITEAQVKAGEVPKTALAQARRALLDQQDQAVQARAQSLTALIAVHKALGGGWGS